MKRERINRESVSRIIQQKNNYGGAYMLDNRSYKNQNYLPDSPLQRIGEEEEDTLQGKFDTPVQRVEDEDDTLQSKFGGTLQKKNETGMPDNLKAGIESLSGFSMDDVRVHYNSSKPATVQALAYTQGTDIHVAPGQEKHLPHEAWHVAQQMAGRVSPTTNINGMPVNDNAALEHEADVMGEKAVQYKMPESAKIIQCKDVKANVIQNFLICNATVHYKMTPWEKSKKVEASAENNQPIGALNNDQNVLDFFTQKGLTYLGDGDKYNARNEGGNSPGHCAEPRALAAALMKIDGRPYQYTQIDISDAKITGAAKRNFIDEYHQTKNPKNCLRSRANIATYYVLRDSQKSSYPRCKTCANWVPKNTVKKEFLK